jgi:hypothetical protein
VIEAGIYNLLAGAPGIAALVGTRIHPMVLPEGSPLPALTYQTVGSSSEPTFATSGPQRLRLEINCWAAGYLDAITLRSAVGATLDGYQGVLSEGTYLQDIQSLQQVDFFETDARQYRAMAEFYLYFNLPST